MTNMRFRQALMPTTTIDSAGPAAPVAMRRRDSGLPGSSEDLARFYADHAAGLRRFAARLTGDYGHAEDIVQETMLRAWHHPELANGRCGTPRAWLYTVARHLIIDEHRARRARPAEVASVAVLCTRAAPDQIGAAITRWDVAAVMAGLQPRHRELLGARYLHDRSIADIAAELHVPAGTVKSRLSAARDALRQSMQPRTRPPARQATAARAGRRARSMPPAVPGRRSKDARLPQAGHTGFRQQRRAQRPVRHRT
jgi:RNA polymerase sigma-70 factor (ECF subfamily)